MLPVRVLGSNEEEPRKKRRKMEEEHQKVLQVYNAFEENTDISKIYPNEFFGYRKVTVDRPLN